MNELLDEVQSLENIGLDLSFVTDLKVDLGMASRKPSTDQYLHKTAIMINDLANMNYDRLGSQPNVTLTDAPQPTQAEIHLADNLVNEVCGLNEMFTKLYLYNHLSNFILIKTYAFDTRLLKYVIQKNDYYKVIMNFRQKMS